LGLCSRARYYFYGIASLDDSRSVEAIGRESGSDLWQRRADLHDWFRRDLFGRIRFSIAAFWRGAYDCGRKLDEAVRVFGEVRSLTS
jgi:hypothetical protein